MELAWSVACAWRIGGGQTRDVVRVFEDEGVLVCALANAYDSGFSTCWPAGSAHLLDLFEAAWRAKKGASPTRLRAAFGLAARAFVESEVALEPRDVDFPDSAGAGSLLVAAIEPSRVELAWLGAGIALVRRGDQILAANRPASLRAVRRALGGSGAPGPRRVLPCSPHFVSCARVRSPARSSKTPPRSRSRGLLRKPRREAPRSRFFLHLRLSGARGSRSHPHAHDPEA